MDFEVVNLAKNYMRCFTISSKAYYHECFKDEEESIVIGLYNLEGGSIGEFHIY